MNRTQLLIAAETLPRKVRREAAQGWHVIAEDFCRRVKRMSEKTRLKSYEVHQTLETAREAALRELVAGNPWTVAKDAAQKFLVLK